jgi:hypothetical protein
MNTNNSYLDNCQCGGELEPISGGTIDTLPALYPVKCILCGKETMSQKIEEVEILNNMLSNIKL